jgi:hypothetical protein
MHKVLLLLGMLLDGPLYGYMKLVFENIAFY